MQGWKDKTILEKLVRKKGQISFFLFIMTLHYTIFLS